MNFLEADLGFSFPTLAVLDVASGLHLVEPEVLLDTSSHTRPSVAAPQLVVEKNDLIQLLMLDHIEEDNPDGLVVAVPLEIARKEVVAAGVT